jgi:hypothetical protein
MAITYEARLRPSKKRKPIDKKERRRTLAKSAHHIEQEGEMKTCPNCDAIMEEIPCPPQNRGGDPKITDVPRVRHQCPGCHHIEEGYPQRHITWDKSDLPVQPRTNPTKQGDT